MTINPRLDAVFIHVTSMSRSIDWYSRLLNLPTDAMTHEGMIYNFPIEGESQIILDGYPKQTPAHGTGPRVMFTTHDIEQAREIASSLSATAGAIDDIGGSLVFYLEDPDGNLICIRQTKPDAS